MLIVVALVLLLLAAPIAVIARNRSKSPENERNALGWILWWILLCIPTAWSALFFVALAMPDPMPDQEAPATSQSASLQAAALFIAIFVIPIVVSLILMFKKRHAIGIAIASLPICLFLVAAYGPWHLLAI